MVQGYLGIKPHPSEPPNANVPVGAIPNIPFKP